MKKHCDITIVIVMGMHRSGTSLTASFLHHSGVVMGEESSFYPPPSIENPRGFYENYKFTKLNNKLLRANNYYVEGWNPNFKDLALAREDYGSIRKIVWKIRKRIFLLDYEMRKLIKNNCDLYDIWGWKDPRQMLTCEHWLRNIKKMGLIDCVKILFCYRNPVSVSLSMMKRGNVETISHGVAVWYTYNNVALKTLKKYRVPTMFISFEDLISDHERISDDLSSFLNIKIEKQTLGKLFSRNYVRSMTELNTDEFGKYDPKVKGLIDEIEKYSHSSTGWSTSSFKQ